MASDDLIRVSGVVKDACRDVFLVETEHGQVVKTYLTGKMRKERIRVVVGDSVEIDISPADLTRGRLVWRKR